MRLQIKSRRNRTQRSSYRALAQPVCQTLFLTVKKSWHIFLFPLILGIPFSFRPQRIVHHIEPAADIPEIEAQSFVDIQQADFVQRILDAAPLQAELQAELPRNDHLPEDIFKGRVPWMPSAVKHPISLQAVGWSDPFHSVLCCRRKFDS